MEDTVWIVGITAFSTLSAGLGGAVIAARSARDRQKDDLKGSADRLQAQLDAEAERLQRQLAHEREMEDLGELRRDVGELTTVFERIENGSLEAVRRISAERSGEPDWLAAGTLIGKVMRLQADLVGARGRFLWRFPPEHRFIEALEAWATAHKKWGVAISEAILNRHRPTEEETQAHLNKVNKGQVAFTKCPFLDAGLRLPEVSYSPPDDPDPESLGSE